MAVVSSLNEVIAHIECCAVIQRWAFARDQKQWDVLERTFTPKGEIAVSWYRGPIAGFVNQLRSRDQSRAGIAKHHVFPSSIQLNGVRALAETSVVIMVRQAINGVMVDLTSRGRFLDRLTVHDGDWLIKERAAVYEQDRLDPVEPSSDFDGLFADVDTSIYPLPYRYMAHRIAAAGGHLAEPVLFDGSSALEDLKLRYTNWLRSPD